VTGQQPKIDLENLPAPAEGILVTHFRAERRSLESLLSGRARWPGRAGREPLHRQARQQLDHHEPGRPAHAGQAGHLGRSPRAVERGLQLPQPEGGRHRGVLPRLESQGGHLRHRADRPCGRDALLHARPRWLSDRGGAGNWIAQGEAHQEAARGPARLRATRQRPAWPRLPRCLTRPRRRSPRLLHPPSGIHVGRVLRGHSRAQQPVTLPMPMLRRQRADQRR
jgi:hypothetical protein